MRITLDLNLKEKSTYCFDCTHYETSVDFLTNKQLRGSCGKYLDSINRGFSPLTETSILGLNIYTVVDCNCYEGR